MSAAIEVDVAVVVGGGAAGLAAAVGLGRSLRSVVVVDAGEPGTLPQSPPSTCWPSAGRRPAGTARGSSPTGAGVLAGVAAHGDLAQEDVRTLVA